MYRKKIRLAIAGSFAVITLLAVGVCIHFGMKSDIFNIENVEIVQDAHCLDESQAPKRQNPVELETLRSLVGVQAGRTNLFSVDIQEIERRLLAHPWIASVRIDKIFPRNLRVMVEFREPRAILQSGNGQLTYVDQNGNIFDELNLSGDSDLPVILISSVEKNGNYLKYIEFIEQWNRSSLSQNVELSQLEWSEAHGLRALIKYPLLKEKMNVRTVVQLGQTVDEWKRDEIQSKLSRLAKVFLHLSTKSIPAKGVMFAFDKKIVVKFYSNS